MRRLLAVTAIAFAAVGSTLPAHAEDTCYYTVAGNTGGAGVCIHPDCSEECYPPSVYPICWTNAPIQSQCAFSPLP
ncbi:MAG TPA: hypothetical protein VFQ85_04605 [Mycobacteriales bacterium]|jgi:hypothetical protein|nr:hypothetical protein [Mycobacteriales bacterium]